MFGALTAFWFSLLAIGYAYAGYPAMLWMLVRVRRTTEGGKAPGVGEVPQPSITLVVSAYNEEQVIGETICNALSLDYPRHLLEIVVVSDGSTDATAEIVSKFANDGVVLRHYAGRLGKTACLNRAVPDATGTIIVFSDANSVYVQGALRALVEPFQARR